MAASKLNRLTPTALRGEVIRLRGDIRLLTDMAKDADADIVYYRRQAKRAQWVGAILVIVTLVALLVSFVPARAHDHDPAASDEQNQVNEFYARWKQPAYRGKDGDRVVSCCNKTDCSRITAMKRNGAQWFIQTEIGGDQWYVVPEAVWEDNTSELLESPDLGSHACIIAGAVVCAVRGSGQ